MRVKFFLYIDIATAFRFKDGALVDQIIVLKGMNRKFNLSTFDFSF